jgi:Hint domain-containing protein
VPFVSVMKIDETLLDGSQTDPAATEQTIANGSILRIPSGAASEQFDFVDDDGYLGDDYDSSNGSGVDQNDITRDTSGQTVDGVRYHLDYEMIVQDSDGNQYSIYVLEEDGRTSGLEDGGDGDKFNDQQWFVFDKDNIPPRDVDLTIVDSVVQGAELPYDMFVACFAEGTEIQMSLGRKMIEGILLGDMVKCADGQMREVRWIGRHRLDAFDLQDRPYLRPICIEKHALGPDMPDQDLRVSPQHRVLVGNARTELMFGEAEMLVAAKHLVNNDTIYVDEAAREVCYYHILFDDHQIIYSNGALTESFYPGAESLRGLADKSRSELFELFPELEFGGPAYGSVARPTLSGREALALRF